MSKIKTAVSSKRKGAPTKKSSSKTTAKKGPVKIKDLKDEKWKKVKTQHPTLKTDYYISNKGRVKSRSKSSQGERILKPTLTNKYPTISVKTENTDYSRLYLHKIAAQLWVKKPSRKHQYVHYKNGDRTNFKASNLEWITAEDRKTVLSDRNTYVWSPKGRSNVKLTEAKVRQIKKMLKVGKQTKDFISKKFKVSSTQIKRIEREENWGHIKV